MKILVYEHITSGALCTEPLPDHLVREGNAMLQALLNDLAGNQGVQPVILRDFRLDIPPHTHRCHYVRDLDDFRRRWLACLDYVDGVLPIAPETDGLLAEVQSWVLKTGKRLLGCRPEATAIAASKTRTAEYLAAAGLTTAPTVWLRDWQPDTFTAGALICKPDDGAGGTDVLYFENATALNTWKQQSPSETWEKQIVQPYIQGTAASLSLLCAEAEAHLLCGNHQQIQIENGAMRLTGITVNGMEYQRLDRKIFQGLADTIASVLPGLWGFVGVDLVLSPLPVVLEINPRLTTSYVGLREVYGVNPASWFMTLLHKGMEAVELPPQPNQKVTISVEEGLAIQATHC
ncbi:ATP-grasp domain-containing protein [Nitrosococcus wardiae]|uniref:ATP-grasp domain-containing protein n=1 Tax=Nitrosococcus wardiae TaxID=1814290 RepID=A0A4P7BVF9_9GAMM|nr:ATP-grasp domain-containing protein [Nitrosococcus wardiae]QBQ53881.1 ATP-grasp domain-containing protein [Nitrosococcus wardiae]